MKPRNGGEIVKTKPVIIHVTQEDIDHGDRADCYSCATALALNRALNLDEFSEVHVWFDGFRIGGEGRLIKFPAEVRRFISYLDAGEPVEPFSFVVRIPA
jgi:hypothetical protein